MSNDKRLSRRASEGDERAFAAIFRRYHQDLYRYCAAILGNPHDAQDALQNTMLSALRALPGESREIELKPWLYRIAHNESIDLVRRRRAGEALDPELAAAGPGLAQEAEARERLGQLLDDIGELPERQRGALLMRELSGLGFEEIGTALGCSAAVARQTTYEARLGLREFEAGREMDCIAVTKALSDADGRVARRRDIRAHLRDCSDCTAFEAEISGRRRDFAALSPLPALVAAGVLKGVLGGGGAAGAAGGGIAGGGLAGSVALKAAATVAVVAALGVGAERGGLIDPVLPGGGGKGGEAAARTKAGPGAEPAGDGTAAPAPSANQDRTPNGRARDVTLAAAAARALAPARATGKGKADAATPAATAQPAATAADQASARGKAKGRGPKPDLPAAAAKGQQKAAEHRNAASGRAEHPARPEHPAHPAPPAKPAKPPKPAKPEKPVAATKQPPAQAKGGETAAPAAKPAPGAGNGKAAPPASAE